MYTFWSPLPISTYSLFLTALTIFFFLLFTGLLHEYEVRPAAVLGIWSNRSGILGRSNRQFSLCKMLRSAKIRPYKGYY